MSLGATSIFVQANGGETVTIGNQTSTFPPQTQAIYSKQLAFVDGTGAGKAQKWGTVQINLAAGASTTVDLTACTGLRSNVNFSKIKFLAVDNTTTDQEVDTLTITGSPTGGTWIYTVGGQPTAGIAYNALAAAVQTAVEALSTVGAGKVTVTGSAGGPYSLTFSTALGALTISASGAGLTGGTTPAATNANVPCNIEVGDDGSGSTVWSAPFKGTNARLVVQPGEFEVKGGANGRGYVVDSTHKNLLIKNVGLVAVTGTLVLLGEGA